MTILRNTKVTFCFEISNPPLDTPKQSGSRKILMYGCTQTKRLQIQCPAAPKQRGSRSNVWLHPNKAAHMKHTLHTVYVYWTLFTVPFMRTCGALMERDRKIRKCTILIGVRLHMYTENSVFRIQIRILIRIQWAPGSGMILKSNNSPKKEEKLRPEKNMKISTIFNAVIF
jgi:hypothetical protein